MACPRPDPRRDQNADGPVETPRLPPQVSRHEVDDDATDQCDHEHVPRLRRQANQARDDQGPVEVGRVQLLLGTHLREVLLVKKQRSGGEVRRSDSSGGLELVDQLARLGQRQVLGAVDAVVGAQETLQVGSLTPRDRHDRPDLIQGRGRAGAAHV